jgi:hypothetical protein
LICEGAVSFLANRGGVTGDPIGDGTAQNLGYGIGVFARIQIQPGALGIPLQ